jgi:predicted transcriptional regulator
MADQPSDTRLLELTAQIVAAHTGNTPTETSALPGTIRQVYSALAGLGKAQTMPAARQEPAVPIRKSVFPDYLVCLEDGKKMKMLKRYLARTYDMTPDAYRQKWGLDPSYPMVAPNYAEKRSALAKQSGLGQRRESDASD